MDPDPALIRKKVEAVEQMLKYHAVSRKAAKKGLPEVEAPDLEEDFIMYEDMNEQELKIEKRQLQELELILLRGIVCSF